MDFLEQLEELVSRVPRGQLDKKVQPVLQVDLDQVGPPGKQVHVVRQVQLGNRDLTDSKALEDLLDSRVLMVNQDLMAILDNRDLQVHLVRMEHLDRKEQLAPKVKLDQQVRQVTQVNKVNQVLQVHRGQLGL